MSNAALIQNLATFLDASPTPYHAVATTQRTLDQKGFTALKEGDDWQLKKGGKYYITRRGASIIAFIYGEGDLIREGIRIIGAHTDSPTLKIKPRPQRDKLSYSQLSIEVYGGVLLYPWYDRDLSVAGMVTVNQNGQLSQHLINFDRPIATIPSLAIHLDRTANNGRVINPQEEMQPIFYQNLSGAKGNFTQMLQAELALNGVQAAESDIKEFDLSFYDTQKAGVVGLEKQFFASARLDNLLSCFAGLECLVAASGKQSVLLALHDHEEVGSRSHTGADGNMLQAFLERLCPNATERYRMMSNSLMISADNAHGIHPNFANKHDDNHGPLLNKGPVIKVDANQSYATTPELAALIGKMASEANVPLQSFVTRADMRCGSTIGPMTSAKLGLRTIDLGLPTFAMHSIRELAGTEDIGYLCELLKIYSEMVYLT